MKYMSNIDQLMRISKHHQMLRWVCASILVCQMSLCVLGQTYYRVDMTKGDSVALAKIDLIPTDYLTLDSTILWISKVQDQGYIEVSVDDAVLNDSLYIGKLHLGPVYQWVRLNNNNINEDILDAARIDLDILERRVVNLKQLSDIKDKILSAYENSGYPYARVWNDHFVISDSSITSDLVVDAGLLVTYEPLVVDGDVQISPSYLSSYLGIKENNIYKRSDLERMADRLNELPFLSMQNNARALFKVDKARIELPLQRRRASRFDFLLGFQPNPGQVDGGVALTGTFLGDFINQLGHGERIYLAFKKLGVGTQELELTLNYPYILGSPFGFDASFDLYKRDSSYINLDAELGIQVLISGNNYVKAFYNNKSTNLAQIDSTRIETGIQEDVDTGFSNFGLELLWKQLNHPYSPTRGFSVKTRGSLGQRTIKMNADILELNAEFYNAIRPSSFQYIIESDLQYYVPIGNRSTILLRSRVGWINGADSLYQNQLFRIGGNQLLRGFDDESIFASLYSVGTIELRYLLGSNRYFFLFGDGAYTEERSVQTNRSDTPVGFGAGLRFQTTAGVFSLTFGLGKQEDSPFDFGRGKVHFGYVTFF